MLIVDVIYAALMLLARGKASALFKMRALHECKCSYFKMPVLSPGIDSFSREPVGLFKTHSKRVQLIPTSPVLKLNVLRRDELLFVLQGKLPCPNVSIKHDV